MGLKFSNVAATFVVKVAHEQLEQHMASSPAIVGGELASQITRYAREQKLGYYPALDFFLEHGGVDRELLDAAESMIWLLTELVQKEVKTRLQPVFSQLRFESVHAVAYTMPTVRPGQNNALSRLTEHYTPDQVKVSLVATSIRHRDTPDNATRMTENMIHRWLKDHFVRLEVSSVRYLEQGE